MAFPEFLFSESPDGNLYVTHTTRPRFWALVVEDEQDDGVQLGIDETCFLDDPNSMAKGKSVEALMQDVLAQMGESYMVWCESLED